MQLAIALVCLLLYCMCGVCAAAVQDQRRKLLIEYTRASAKSKEEVCNRQFIDITVSPLVTKTVIRNLEVTWEVDRVLQGDWIGLYVQNPRNLSASPVFTFNPTTRRGWKATPFTEKRLKYSDIFKPYCLGFWVAYLRREVVIAMSCLQSNPTWMYDNKDLIGKLKLRELFLPGTHNSGSYLLREAPFTQSRYQKYVYTQDESVLNQLIHGVRYLDLRVGFGLGTWWLQHDVFKVRLLQEVIDDIKLFIKNTQEIIIVDFHRFLSDFDKKHTRHKEFMEYLESQFSSQMATPALSWFATLEDIWQSDTRLIVSYNNRSVVENMQYNVWKAVTHKWPNVRDIVKMRDYFADVIRSHPSPPWAAMAQFTPTTWDVIYDNLGGLRKMADMSNRYVTQWFRSSWGDKCNIVAMDFVRGSGIVNAAIELNIIRQNNHC